MLKDTIKTLQQDIGDVIKFDEVGFGLEKINIIDELLQNNHEVSASPESRQILTEMRKQLELMCLPNLDDDSVLDFLRSNLILALSFPGYDIEEKLGQKISFKELDEFQVDFAEKVLKVITENNEKIGENNLDINGKVVPPYIKSWLLDYKYFPKKGVLWNNLDEIEYIDKSSNSGSLDKKNRDILLAVLKLHDLLFNLIKKHNSQPEIDDESVAFQGFSLYKWLPGLDDETIKPTQIDKPFSDSDGLQGAGLGTTVPTSNYVSKEKFILPKDLLSKPVVPQVPRPSLAKIPASSSDLGSPPSNKNNIEEHKGKPDVVPPSRQDLTGNGGGRSGGGAGNQKAAPFGAANSLDPMNRSRPLTYNSISEEKFQEKIASSPDKALAPRNDTIRGGGAGAGYQPLNRRNIQDILQSKQQMEAGEQAGLKMRDGGSAGMQNEESSFAKATEDKLRMKNGGAAGQKTGMKNDEFRMKNGQPEIKNENQKAMENNNKPIAQVKQMDINRKLAELRKKAGGGN